MSWYRVQEIDVLRVGQLYIQGGIGSTYPSAGTVLYSDGIGGTFFSTAGGGGGGGTVTDTVLTSTIVGLGTASYVSSPQLLSTVAGLGNLGYLVSSQLLSTVTGLGTASYVSSPQLLSSIAGLGTASYVSSPQLLSSITSLLTNYRSLSVNISTLTTSNLTGITGYVSSFQVDSLQFGTGAGWVQFGPVQASIVSTIQLNVNTIFATQISTSSLLGVSLGGGGGTGGGSTLSSLFVGSTSNQNFIKFWGRIGEYNNAAIVEQSTGGFTGEVFTFKGSSVSDQIRFQTTGAIRFETGAPTLRDVNSASQLATPSMILTNTSNVGILTNNPSFTLDVTGSGRFTTLVSTTSLYAGSYSMGLYFA